MTHRRQFLQQLGLGFGALYFTPLLPTSYTLDDLDRWIAEGKPIVGKTIVFDRPRYTISSRVDISYCRFIAQERRYLSIVNSTRSSFIGCDFGNVGLIIV
jgi:hypothetical protein